MSEVPYTGPRTLNLVLPHGQSEVLSAQEFISRRIKRVAVPHDTVTVITHDQDLNVGLWDPSSINRPTSPMYSRREVPLKPNSYGLPKLLDQFKILLSKKPIQFNVNQLSIESITDLSTKFMMNFEGDAFIVLTELNPYLKLVTVIAPDALEVYGNESTNAAAVVEINPSRWFVGRYESADEMFRSVANNMHMRY